MVPKRVKIESSDHFFEARAEVQKHFVRVLVSNENFEICFRDLLTFRLYTDAHCLSAHCAWKLMPTDRTTSCNWVFKTKYLKMIGSWELSQCSIECPKKNTLALNADSC